MLPLLKFAGDQREHSLREAIEKLAEEFGLTDEERKELLPSGQQTTFDNRVGWARTYLKKANLIDSPRRGYFRITGRGLDVLKQNLQEIDNAFLKQFPEFVEFKALRREREEESLGQERADQTPEERIEAAHQSIRQDLITELLQTIKNCSSGFFERLVVDLLVKMGYGGTRREAGQAIGRSHDGGIDGVINEYRLGLDTVYIQAKRWDGPVGRPEIQKFAGALQGQHARKGIFITNSAFTKEAHDCVSRIDSKVVLIDGEQMAKLMIDYNIGVTTVASYELKRVDSDYFTEE
jgi:restriction system protein